MFRDLTRKSKQLSQEECARILEAETRGVLSVMGDEGYPYGMPMNHWYDRESGKIYFHTGIGGHRSDSISRCDKVSFCVHDSGVRPEGEWAFDVRSVIVFGRVRELEDLELIRDITRKLSYKFTQDEGYIEEEIRNHARATRLLELTPEHICGKRVKEA